MSDIFDFLRVPFTIIVGALISSLIYKYFVNKKKEQEKIGTLKQQMQTSDWISPLNNGGLYIGFFILFLALAQSFIPDMDASMPFLVNLVTYGISFLFMLLPHSIRLTKEFIEIQPILLRFLQLPLAKKVMFYRDIVDVKKERQKGPYSEFSITLKVKTHSGTTKINTLFYNTEIPNALYEVLKSRAGA